MVRTLDRYVLRNFLANYVLSLFVLISLYVVLDLLFNLDEFTEGGKPVLLALRDIGDYYLYNIPLYFSQLSGVLCAFAACATLARLQKQNEMTAILASGTSAYRVAAPIILAGLAMNVLLVVDHEVILPQVAAKLARSRDDVEGARAYGVWCVRDGENRLLSARQFSPKQRRIRGLTIMELSTDHASLGRLGDIVTADQAEWDEERHGWNLIRGIRVPVEAAATAGLRGDHSIERVPIRFYRCELTPEELLFRQKAQWIRFLSLTQLTQLEKQGDANPTQIAQVRHGRFTLPINNMIMLLLGISFFMHRLPGSVLTQGAKALGTCAASFMIVFVGQQLLGSAGIQQYPALPAWLPIFLFGPFAVVLLDGVKT